MKVNSGVAFFIILGVFAAVVAIVIGSVIAYVHFAPKIADQKLHAEMIRLHSAANVYYKRIGSFTGVCGEIGVDTNPDIDCNESSVAYAISTERPNGTFYCIDRSENVNEQITGIRGELSCKQNQ